MMLAEIRKKAGKSKEKDPALDPEPVSRKENPELKEKRERLRQAAKGDKPRKRGRPTKEEQAKRKWNEQIEATDNALPPESLRERWEEVSEFFVMLSEALIIVFFGVDNCFDDDEFDRLKKAWSAFFAVQPPENVTKHIKWGLLFTYLWILAPRVMKKAPEWWRAIFGKRKTVVNSRVNISENQKKEAIDVEGIVKQGED